MGIPWEVIKRRQIVDEGWEDLPSFGGKWWEFRLDMRLLRGCWVLTLASGQEDGRGMRARHARGACRLPHANYLFGIWVSLVVWKSHLYCPLLWGVDFILKAVYALLIQGQQKASWPSPKFSQVSAELLLGSPSFLTSSLKENKKSLWNGCTIRKPQANFNPSYPL